MDNDYDTLVLSGGGIKGFCLLGGVQAAFDLGLLKNIDTYVGTSVGAMIGYLLAIGYTPIEIIVSLYTNRWLEKMQYFNLVAMINGNGATSFTNLNEALEKLTLAKIGRLLTLGKLNYVQYDYLFDRIFGAG
jgi:predicted acylesterase/phospholipase RssA